MKLMNNQFNTINLKEINNDTKDYDDLIVYKKVNDIGYSNRSTVRKEEDKQELAERMNELIKGSDDEIEEILEKNVTVNSTKTNDDIKDNGNKLPETGKK